MDKQISQKQQRQIQLNILISVDEFCKQNNIQYSLAFGTLLGAVRHQGFIPWDDDMDIMMTRENYEKFRSIYKSDRYPLIDLKIDNRYPLSMGKLHDSSTYYFRSGIRRNFGLFIDIFPIDNVPDDEKTRLKWLKEIQRYNALNITKNNTFSNILFNSSFSSVYKLKCLIVKILYSSTFIHRKLEKLYIMYNSRNSKYVGVPAVMSMKESFNSKFFPKEIFQDYILLKFDNYYFPAIKNYDEFLCIFYGDYLELPPIDQRKGKHDIVAYFK